MNDKWHVHETANAADTTHVTTRMPPSTKRQHRSVAVLSEQPICYRSPRLAFPNGPPDTNHMQCFLGLIERVEEPAYEAISWSNLWTCTGSVPLLFVVHKSNGTGVSDEGSTCRRGRI